VLRRRFARVCIPLALLALAWTGPGLEPLHPFPADSLLASAQSQQEPLNLIPADALLCWHGRAFPDTQPMPDSTSPILALLDAGASIAGQPLSPRTRLTIRGLEALSAVMRYPYAVALIDVRAREDAPDADETVAESRPARDAAQGATSRPARRGSRVDHLRLALVVDTQGRSEPFLRIIQKVVNEQTGSDVASLEAHRAERWSYQELRDQRLPEWCRIAWGEIEGQFVITVGEEVWPQVAAVAAGRERSLARDPWVAEARRGGRAALVEITVAAQRIRERLDPFVQGRASDFFAAWSAEDLERAHWALGFQGRAMFCVAQFLEGGTTRERVYADPAVEDERVLGVVPRGARYAVYRLRLTEFLPRLIHSAYATRGREYSAQAARRWTQVQLESGFDGQRDLLDHLGPHMILHNDPPHPLHLPLMFTSLVEIQSQPEAVRRSIDLMSRAWQGIIAQSEQKRGQASVVQVRLDGDGVWSVQWGPVPGPAWTVTDRFVVLSWSPAALRAYLSRAAASVGAPLPTTAVGVASPAPSGVRTLPFEP
jgi:hypothetical protein